MRIELHAIEVDTVCRWRECSVCDDVMYIVPWWSCHGKQTY